MNSGTFRTIHKLDFNVEKRWIIVLHSLRRENCDDMRKVLVSPKIQRNQEFFNVDSLQ